MNVFESTEIVFSVREGIVFCLENGLESAFSQLESFDKSKKLGTNQLKKLKGNLECLAEEVEITGGGKSGKVILKGLKDTPTQRVTGNTTNGRKLTKEDKVMKEYLFKALRRNYNSFDVTRTYTVNQLGNLIDLITITDENSAAIEKETLSIFNGFYNDDEKEKVIHIKANARKSIENRKREDVKLFIEHLHKEGKVYANEKYMVKYLEDSYVINSLKQQADKGERVNLYHSINENQYIRIRDDITEIAISNGLTYKTYVQADNGFIERDKKISKMMLEVKEYYEQNGYEYIFISIEIQILQPDSYMEITKQEAREAFERKIIRLTNERMLKEKYHNRTKYTKEFYRLAMFVILRHMKVEGLDKVITEEINQIPIKLDEMNRLHLGEIIKPTFEKLIANKDIFDIDVLHTNEIEINNTQREQIEETIIVQKKVHPDRKEEFEYFDLIREMNRKNNKIKKTEPTTNKKMGNLGKINRITTNRIDKNLPDYLGEEMEREEAKRKALELKKKEENRCREARSLPFGSTFNIKPEEFRVKWDNSLLEIHSEEELEMMGEEHFKNWIEYCG